MNYRIGTETNTSLKNATGLQHAVDAGFGWYRHMQINWSDWEPVRTNPPTYIPPENDPTDNKAWRVELDDSIVRATAQGMKTIICVRHAPAWAVSSGVAGCGALKLSALAPFAEFMDYIIARYKGSYSYNNEVKVFNVLHYELWNEPDMAVDTNTDKTGERGCWYPLDTGPYRYTLMLSELRARIMWTHQDVFIMNGGLSYNTSTEREWARRMLTGRDNNGVQVGIPGINYLDILAYHAYDWTSENDAMWEMSSGVRPLNYMRVHDLLKGLLPTDPNLLPDKRNIPIWMNEGGLLAKGHEGSKLRLKQAYHIAYMLADMCTEEVTKGPDKFFWWRLVEDPNKSYHSSTLGNARGTYPNEYYEPRQHFAAFQFGLPFVEGTIMKWEETRANGKVKYIHFRKESQPGLEYSLLINTNGASHTPFTYDFTDSYFQGPPGVIWDVFGNQVSRNGSTIYLDDPHRVLWIQWAAP